MQLIDDELRIAGVPENQTEAWAGDVKAFRRTEAVLKALNQAFEASNSAVDGELLKQGWRQLPEPSPLPPGFDWDYVAKSFSRNLRKLREEDNDLRQVLQTQAVVETAAHTRQALGVQPDFHLQNYRDALLERYANLHFDTIDTSGANYFGVKLWSVFVPQTARESGEYLPQVYEIPKEYLRRLVESGELDASDATLAKELVDERHRTYLDQSPRSKPCYALISHIFIESMLNPKRRLKSRKGQPETIAQTVGQFARRWPRDSWHPINDYLSRKPPKNDFATALGERPE